MRFKLDIISIPGLKIDIIHNQNKISKYLKF